MVAASPVDDRVVAWCERVSRELPGVASSLVQASALEGLGSANALDADLAIVLDGGPATLTDLSRIVAATGHALERGAASRLGTGAGSTDVAGLDAGIRIALVSDAPDARLARGTCAHFTTESADTQLLSFLRGVLAVATPLRETRRELSLLGRVVASMRGELEERNEELQLAALVQRDFLPLPLPPVHGVRAGAFYRPLAGVSGDVYHLEQTDEDHLAFFLADAVGHGIPAALLGMAVCRSLELVDRSPGSRQLLGPAETLARANRRLVEHQRATTRFATAVAGVIDCRTRRLRLASAGHPACVLLRVGEDPRMLECDGGLLGVFPDETFPEIEVKLEPNDRILVYSDGFEQAFGGDGTPRHIQEFGRLSGALGADQLVEQLAARVDGEAGSLHQADDLTLLCIAIEEASSLRLAA